MFFFSFMFFCTFLFILFHSFLFFVRSKLFFTSYYSYSNCLLFVILSCQLQFIDVNLCLHSTPSHSSALVHHSSTFQTCSCLLLLLWLCIGTPTCPPFCFVQIWEWEVKVQGLNFIYKVKFLIFSFSLFQCFVYVFISLFICVFVSFGSMKYVILVLCLLIIQHFCCLLCVGFV